LGVAGTGSSACPESIAASKRVRKPVCFNIGSHPTGLFSTKQASPTYNSISNFKVRSQLSR
jgi:hypothetical protein